MELKILIVRGGGFAQDFIISLIILLINTRGLFLSRNESTCVW